MACHAYHVFRISLCTRHQKQWRCNIHNRANHFPNLSPQLGYGINLYTAVVVYKPCTDKSASVEFLLQSYNPVKYFGKTMRISAAKPKAQSLWTLVACEWRTVNLISFQSTVCIISNLAPQVKNTITLLTISPVATWGKMGKSWKKNDRETKRAFSGFCFGNLSFSSEITDQCLSFIFKHK